jgi:hypothetical protein
MTSIIVYLKMLLKLFVVQMQDNNGEMESVVWWDDMVTYPLLVEVDIFCLRYSSDQGS